MSLYRPSRLGALPLAIGAISAAGLPAPATERSDRPEPSAEAPAGRSPAAPSEAPPFDPLADALHFRRLMGLATDRSLVAAIATDPAAVSDLGFPLTVAEAGQARRQFALQTHLSVSQARIEAAFGPRFAGLWIDQSKGGVVHLAVRGSAAGDRATIAALLPPSTPIEITRTVRSLGQLRARSAEVAPARRALAAQGVQVVAWGPDIRSNTVAVAVVRPTAATEKLLKERFDPASITVLGVDAPPVDESRELFPPMKAGLRAFRDDTDDYCTTGPYVAPRKTKLLKVLTAGHCGSLGSGWAVGREAWDFGTMVQDSERYGSYADAATITVDPYDATKSCVYVNHKACPPFQAASNAVMGTIVLMSGAATGVSSGVVKNTCFDYSSTPDRLTRCTAKSDYRSAQGDSGGPVFFPTGKGGVAFAGIHLGSLPPIGAGPTHRFFSQWSQISKELNVEMVL